MFSSASLDEVGVRVLQVGILLRTVMSPSKVVRGFHTAESVPAKGETSKPPPLGESGVTLGHIEGGNPRTVLGKLGPGSFDQKMAQILKNKRPKGPKGPSRR